MRIGTAPLIVLASTLLLGQGTASDRVKIAQVSSNSYEIKIDDQVVDTITEADKVELKPTFLLRSKLFASVYFHKINSQSDGGLLEEWSYRILSLESGKLVGGFEESMKSSRKLYGRVIENKVDFQVDFKTGIIVDPRNSVQSFMTFDAPEGYWPEFAQPTAEFPDPAFSYQITPNEVPGNVGAKFPVKITITPLVDNIFINISQGTQFDTGGLKIVDFTPLRSLENTSLKLGQSYEINFSVEVTKGSDDQSMELLVDTCLRTLGDCGQNGFDQQTNLLLTVGPPTVPALKMNKSKVSTVKAKRPQGSILPRTGGATMPPSAKPTPKEPQPR